MGRPLRRHEPGQLYLVTTRCHQARFFLRPDRELNDAVLEWLARAQQRFPRLRSLAVCVLSNHLHLVVRDEDGELAAWASYFLGHVARAVNRIRGRSGSCFERRYSAEPILDDEALFDRLVYVAANPVNAGLCERVRDWPGVVLFSPDGDYQEIPVSWVDRDPHRFACVRARLRGESAPEGDAFRMQGRLVVDPLPSTDPSRSDGEALSAAIKARERELAEERCRTGRKTLSRKQLLAQSWRSAPRQPKRSPRPLCHAADPDLRERFRKGFREFASLFREASERLRGGQGNVSFPDWCYPPGLPLLRPARVGAAWSGAG
jgi:REP element-mobilizing transposase RayT